MKRMTLPAILMAAVLAFALAGCSSQPQAQNMTEDTLKGVWKLDSGSNLGMEGYVSFEDDEVVEMILGDSWLDGTWSVSGTSGSLVFTSYDDYMTLGDEDESESSSSSSSDAERTAKISYIDNKVVLGSQDSSKLVFVKDDSEEAKSMFSFGMSDMDGLVDANGNPIEEVEEVIEDIEPITLADDDKMTIVVTGKGTDYTADPCYVVSMTNKTDKDVYVLAEDEFTVGGTKVEAGLGDDVAAGETVEIEIFFDKTELGGGVEKLSPTDGVMVVYDNDTDDEVAKYTFHVD